MAAPLAHYFDEGNRILVVNGRTRFSLFYSDEDAIERRQLKGRFGNLIDVYFFLPSMMRATVDRDSLIVTTRESAKFSFSTEFSLDEARDLSNLLKEKYEANIRSRGRNLSVVKQALMQSKLNPDVLAHIASFSTGKEGTLAMQENRLKQNLDPHAGGRRNTRKHRVL